MRTAFFLILCVGPAFVTCQNGTHVKALRTQKFDTEGYDKKIRSVTDQSSHTVVYVSFSLLAIDELDEVKETLKTTGFLEVLWLDDFLKWTPADYGGPKYYFFPQDDIWKPDIALKNSVEKYKPLGVTTLNVQVTSDGLVSWFPFEVYIVGGKNGLDLSQYSPNSEWDIIDSIETVEEETNEASVIYTLKIERKPRYMVLSVILPFVMLSVLNLFVFVLPCDSGEKASYAITVFLAFTVFLTIISSALPRNSKTLSKFLVYIVILTVQSTLITITALVVIRIRQLESPVPKIVVRITNFLHCECCSKERDTTHDTCDWKKVANGLDRLFFCLYTFVTLVSALVCRLY